jgi:hypothetical protein
MTAINFGVGTAIGRRTDVSNPTPSFLGILQEIDISFDQTLKELMGQYKMPVDVAPAQLKVTGKAKFARISAYTINDLFLGDDVTLASGERMAIAEAQSVPATPGPYTVTVTNSATFENDLGVFYSSTGIQLVRVASGPTVGQYSVSAGVYTFAAADQAIAMLIYYDYTVTNLKKISMDNKLMGTGPTFELCIQEAYTNNLGTTNYLFLKLNACRSSKMTMPFKNMDYTISEFDFTAFADQSNNWGAISTSE